MEKQKNKVFLDRAWAKKFLAKRRKKYWPDSKKIISLRIELIKVFLNYYRFTVRYYILLENKNGKTEEKIIIVKAERPAQIDWPPRIGEVQQDFLANCFLRKNGLGDFIPRPLEFYAPLKTYLYEETPGQPLKNFIKKNNWRPEFFYKKIPAVMEILKKLHSIKKYPPFPSGNPRKIIHNELQRWLDTITKYYPAGKERAKNIAGILKRMEKKYGKNFFDKKKYNVTHGDFQNDNILVDGRGKIYFIDFADCKYFNPLDDLASYLIQSESHLKYVKPAKYGELTKKLERIVYLSYFGRKPRPKEEMQVKFFSAKDILRIITFVSIVQKSKLSDHEHSQMMDDLLTFAEEKIKNLEKKYL